MKTVNRRNMIVPVLELAKNDATGLPFRADPQGNLQIEGPANDEILVSPGPIDSFGLFRATGRVSLQPRAYSLPLQVEIEVERSGSSATSPRRWLAEQSPCPCSGGKETTLSSHV